MTAPQYAGNLSGPLKLPDWRRLGRCAQPDVNPDLFFPGRGGSTKDARAICALCPVGIREKCRIWALEENEPFGIWGGTSGRERRLMQQYGVTHPVYACGHAKAPENTYRSGGSNRCATCERARKARAA